MNYFNYFTEIEEEFVKRRGSHMLVSPLDWSLIETWQQRGVPLNVVLRGINASFEGYNGRLNYGRKVNSLFFCQQEVEAMFLAHCQTRVGANGTKVAKGKASVHEPMPVTPETTDTPTQLFAEVVMNYLTQQQRCLMHLATTHEASPELNDAFARTAERLAQIIEDVTQAGALNSEALETDLAMIEEVILDGLKEHAGTSRLRELKRDAAQQLRAYKQTMEREVYQQTLDNLIARRLRDHYQVPRLSLFYL